ncbi:MAG TPA: PEP-CTERM sorting domain-containing protein [Candidatus Aquilonibacter sp.]|nr:PEP-CTERM sorting domain-containing protein [Candidatus Aquilonibacter sp.]
MARSLRTSLMFSIMILCVTSFALADPVEVLNFRGLKDQQLVGNFYNGGYSGAQNFGVVFSSDFYGLIPTSRGGSGNFTPNPTGSPAIFSNTGSGYMNVMNGFGSGINFFYTAAFQETVKVWSGTNGTGTLLATIILSPNDASCLGSYCNWTDIGANFSGTAKSVTFSGQANKVGIADITLGQSSSAAVPEPSSIYLLGTGLAGVGGYWMRRLVRL